MNRTAFIVFAACALTSACSTLNSSANISHSSPKYFTGTRLNVAAINNDYDTLFRFGEYGMWPAQHPAVDLPFSVALDVACCLTS